MKKITLTILAAAAFAALSSSCKKGDTGPSGATGATGPAGPTLSGTLEGYVDLFDQYGDLVSNAVGVSVTIPGKTGADSTNSGGMFTKSLTTGTYELDFAKSGYGSTKVVSLNFVGGGTQYIQNHVQLTQIPTFSLSGLTAAVGTSTVNPAVTVTITPGSTDTKVRKAICFFGNSASVSYMPGSYLNYQVINIPANVSSATANILASQTLYESGATSGSTLYLVAYPIAFNSSASAYADPVTGKTIFNNILTTSATPTQTVTVP
jgi:hypothetical protein